MLRACPQGRVCFYCKRVWDSQFPSFRSVNDMAHAIGNDKDARHACRVSGVFPAAIFRMDT